MLQRVQSYIKKQSLPLPPTKIIVGVSGGVDSVVLLHLLHELGYECVVTHCNFHLRGEESMRDELFVKQLCEKSQISFLKKDFDTDSYAAENQLSIEMAARELRYEWFEKVRLEEKAEAIAVGHHTDDMVETFLMNLTRGTGIQGLTGIKPRNGYIIRPLLECTREEIEDFAHKNKLSFVIDSSNIEQTYTRNKYRHAIIPLFKQVNPSFLETMKKNITSLNEVAELYRLKIEEIKADVLSVDSGEISISLEKLKSYPSPTSILYEILSPYGFSTTVIQELNDSINAISGKQFFSDTHKALKDRNTIVIVPITKHGNEIYSIEQQIKEITIPCRLRFQELKQTSNFKIHKEKRFAYIDADTLEYPLQIRRWKKGDTFYPFGMNQKKKLSDFFVDNKFSLVQKEKTWVLFSGQSIVWIIGERLDNRFKITPKTRNILQIEVF